MTAFHLSKALNQTKRNMQLWQASEVHRGKPWCHSSGRGEVPGVPSGTPRQLHLPICPAEGTPKKLSRAETAPFCRQPPPAKARCAGESSVLIFQARHFFTTCFRPQSLNLPVLLCESLPPPADLAAWPRSRRRCCWCGSTAGLLRC